MKYIVLLLTFTFTVFANTTMCYKNNIKDISTVEDKFFSGGECNGLNSINDMKKQSWSVDDIQISKNNDGFNFIYILKKDEQIKTVLVNSKTGNNVNLSNGKRIYKKVCQSCHGDKGELTPYNSSDAINSFDLNTMQRTIRDYSMDEQDKGFAMIMKPYADSVTSNDIENIYKYLKSINKK